LYLYVLVESFGGRDSLWSEPFKVHFTQPEVEHPQPKRIVLQQQPQELLEEGKTAWILVGVLESSHTRLSKKIKKLKRRENDDLIAHIQHKPTPCSLLSNVSKLSKKDSTKKNKKLVFSDLVLVGGENEVQL